MSQWRKTFDRISSVAMQATEFVQIRRDRRDSGGQIHRELFATVAHVPFVEDDEIFYSVGIAVKGPRDSACRRIGRQIAEGRAQRTIAERCGVVEAPRREQFNTRTVMTPSQYDLFVELARAKPENILTHRRTAMIAAEMLSGPEASVEILNA